MASLMPPPLTLACHGFSPSDVEALRSLLGLLQRYLKHPWRVASRVDSACTIALINLDHPDRPDLPAHVRQIGCALKPRQQASGCLHRPLRAAEILTLLSEHVIEEVCPQPCPEPGPSLACRYRLHAWPLVLTDWSRPAWRIMAVLSHRSLDAQEIRHRTGIGQDEIDETLRRLGTLQLLTRHTDTPTPVAIAPVDDNPWRAIAGRVGKLLGLTR